MILKKTEHLPATDKGTRVALIYALVAERLGAFYEHGQWLTVGQGASLCAEWLARSKRSLALAERQQLSSVSDELARSIAAGLSREAGLYTAHELSESLSVNYHSEVGAAIMVECERALDAGCP
jgi:hypothetical protein